MLSWLFICSAAVCAGVVQTVTGFGAGIVLMLVMPHFFDMLSASAITSAISLGLTVSLAVQFHKYVRIRLVLVPMLVYTFCAVGAINIVKHIDLSALAIAFGVFLLLLSLYYLIFAEHTSGSRKWWFILLCSLISGISSGLFGIGGPLMAICFLALTENHDSYTGNLQFLFLIAGISNLIARIANGIYTAEMLPLTLLCFLFINAGKHFGIAIAKKMDTQAIKKSVYIFIGLSGIVTLIKHLPL